MNQTQKRLSIIKLAISIGDSETIQLQILKLSPLKTDERVQEIIKGLQAGNYAQTQALITEYIETPTEEILQRTSQNEKPVLEDEEAIIEEFDLFRVKTDDEEEIQEITDLKNINTLPVAEERRREINFDSLLDLKSDDILTENIDISQTSLPKDDFFDIDKNAEKLYNYTEVVEKDDFFHSEEPEKKTGEEIVGGKTEDFNTDTSESNEAYKKNPEESNNKQNVPLHTFTKKRISEPSVYEAIPHIDQKLKNMQTQYPSLETAEESSPSVDAWLTKIANEGYTEKDVEAIMEEVQKLTEEGKKAEAAQLLLISAAAQSKFAQFMLARSLFRGDLLEKNLDEAFTLINRLAMDDDYAEAICDLGQLYEHGIGINKDKKRAEELYKEAMELGIKRACAHYERVHKQNKGLFSFLRR